MKQDIEQYVKGCAICQESKINTKPLKPTMIPITPEHSLPFQTIAMDFIMKLPQSGGYDSILTITNHDCSKVIILIPCKESITPEGVVALILKHIFTRYGAPKKFITDRDTRFTSKVAREYCNKFKIQQNMSTAYHPRTNGQAERTNQEAEIYLCMYCNKQQNDWHLWLPLAEFAHNQHPSATTGQTPFSMIMGYTPKVEWPSALSQVLSYSKRMEQIEQVHEAAKASLEKAQKMMAIRNPDYKRFCPYQEGNLVWIEDTNLKTLYPSAKLAPKHYGPFEVIKQLSPAVYSIKIPHHWKIHNTFHANLITLYKETIIHGSNYSQQPPDLVNGEEVFEVEQILDMKQMGRGHKTHYLIKWKGYPTSDNLWEPEKNLNADELIAEFKRSFRPKEEKCL